MCGEILKINPNPLSSQLVENMSTCQEHYQAKAKLVLFSQKSKYAIRHPGTIWRWESGSRGHPAGAAVGQHLSGETTLQPPCTPRLEMLRAYK